MPTGAALAVPLTLIVMIFGAGSVSTPPLSDAAVVADLEGERRVGDARVVGGRRKGQLVARDVGRQDGERQLALRNGHVVELQRAGRGRLEIVTDKRPLAGTSNGSLKPKSLVLNVLVVAWPMVMVVSLPRGASFTAPTATVIVAGVGSVSTRHVAARRRCP